MEENYTIDQIREDIIEFKKHPDSQKLENFYYSKSFSEILGVSRREISHSGFIAWLLDNTESHKLGDFPIKKFLDIVLTCDKQKDRHSELYNTFVNEDYKIKKLSVKTEKAIDKGGRLDIYIELTMLIAEIQKKVKLIIENKVYSKEKDDQTNKYYDYFNEKKKEDGETIIYIYLTPISKHELKKIEKPKCDCKEFIQINYQSIVDYLIEPALNQNISNETKNILNEYLKSLSQPSIEYDDKEKKDIIE